MSHTVELLPACPGWRLISWNVAGRLRLLGRQAAALLAHNPDIVALQEVISSTAGPWAEAMRAAGLRHVVHSFALASDPTLLRGPRRYGELIASRWPLDALAPERFAVPWPERVLSVQAASPLGPLEVHTVYIPPGITNDWVKIETLNGLCDRLARPSAIPRVLCGDFNAPQAEWPDQTIVTWAQTIRRDGSAAVRAGWRGGRGVAWDQGERRPFEELPAVGLADVYRLLHGWDTTEPSWVWRAKGRRRGWRFDHIFASGVLNPVACRYLHALREEGLSDHSPIEACFMPGSSMRPAHVPSLPFTRCADHRPSSSDHRR